MATVTDIANLALDRIGEPRITDISENSPNAITCRLHYETVRDSLLRSHPWNFATTRVELSQDATDPVFGWAYSYQLPADWVRLSTLNGLEAKRCSSAYTIEGSKLLTNATSAKVTYVKQVTDPNDFDALFLDVLAFRLAAAIAMGVTGSEGKRDGMEQMAALRLDSATFTDAGETAPELLSPFSGSMGMAIRGAGGLLGGGFQYFGNAPDTGIDLDDGADGLNGWTPTFAIASDGDRRVVQITGWDGGAGTEPSAGYIGASGVVALVANGVDLRGLTGSTGSTGAAGSNGTDGNDGWSPEFAVVADGTRRVLQVSDWTGGEGTKPATGLYVGATGLEALIGDGVDIRGASGAGTGDVVGPAGATANAIVLFNGTTGTSVKDSTYTITAAGAALLDDADATAQRATLGLGSLATQSGTFSGTSSGTNTGDQTPTSLGLIIGTHVQAYDADLTTWAGVTPGTGVATALAVNVGTAGAPVVNGGAGGTPASLTLTNATGLPTAGLVDDAVTLAKMAAGTAGNLITYDASGNPAAVATGTATHVLTSNGAGAAPTFQAAAAGGSIGAAEAALYTSGVQTLTDSYADVTGSSVTIVPTSTASKILYSFSFMAATTGTGQPIASFRFYRDGSEITSGKSQISLPSACEGKMTFQFSTANTSTSSTTFKLQARRLSSTFPCKLHETYYFDGGVSSNSSSASVSAIEIID